MKKQKGQTVDLLYINKEEVNKKTKSKPQKTIGNNKIKKTKGKKNANNNKKQKGNSEIINLDNEIIIGLTPKREEKEKKTSKNKQKSIKKKKNKKLNSKKTVATNNSAHKKRQDKKNNKKIKKQSPKNKVTLKFIKWGVIIILLITTIILFMMSSIFNIKEIAVINNKKISAEEIINLSQLTIGINMFKTTNGQIRNNIKKNAYIENVNIKRSINGTITLDITERTATYMLKTENSYVYINNQGYILEVSEKASKLPIITGYTTSNEELNPNNRLNVDDLKKLDDVIKIIEASKNVSLKEKKNTLASLITQIDISNNLDYKLTLKSEGKTVQIGEIKELNEKLGMIANILKQESGKNGQIYFQKGLDNKTKAIFREKVSR